jgi:hypothetical protein
MAKFASPPKQDIRQHGRHVRSGLPDIAKTYSITSSARASSVGAISIPSALPALTLTTS